MNEISVDDWKETTDKAAYQIVDVRNEFEFKGAYIPGSINCPLDQIDLAKVNSIVGDQKILLVCQSGVRSKKAALKLVGFKGEVVSLEGGINAWKDAKLDLIENKKVISLERQVRICAGLLILTGIILMKLGVNGAEYLSVFVGAGLVFAGISDTCGMGILLSKMPWNKKG
ncbi:rhodanese-like domain-containing protein [Lentisphaera marina]|uniref:rhodanese-like domain-containing protein n=1 Tax=Lentisphaera marina TaxID=1111041 RepID=UPI002366EE3E|nr:rhodanese-like domain-containing protein [Lentisphaera marina]MDD7986954.1 rhodanese-like domain-containing protein [Lentisphaera marina]